jgi:hypothetical protein
MTTSVPGSLLFRKRKTISKRVKREHNVHSKGAGDPKVSDVFTADLDYTTNSSIFHFHVRSFLAELEDERKNVALTDSLSFLCEFTFKKISAIKGRAKDVFSTLSGAEEYLLKHNATQFGYSSLPESILDEFKSVNGYKFGFMSPSQVVSIDPDIVAPFLSDGTYKILQLLMPSELFEGIKLSNSSWNCMLNIQYNIYAGIFCTKLASLFSEDRELYNNGIEISMVHPPFCSPIEWQKWICVSDKAGSRIYIHVSFPFSLRSIGPSVMNQLTFDTESSPICSCLTSGNTDDAKLQNRYADMRKKILLPEHPVQQSLLLAKKWISARKDIFQYRFGVFHWKYVLYHKIFTAIEAGKLSELSSLDAVGWFQTVLALFAQSSLDTLKQMSCRNARSKSSCLLDLVVSSLSVCGSSMFYTDMQNLSMTLDPILKREALGSLLLLKQHQEYPDAFDTLFIHTHTYSSRFDDVFSVHIENVDSIISSTPKKSNDFTRKLKNDFSKVFKISKSSWSSVAKWMYDLLDCGLGTRLLRSKDSLQGEAVPFLDISIHFPETLYDPDGYSGCCFRISLSYSIDQHFRLVDKGPNSMGSRTEVTEAWRNLWGDKSELRKFKDGSLVEAVVWPLEDAQDNGSPSLSRVLGPRYGVSWKIIKYLLSRHLGILRNCTENDVESCFKMQIGAECMLDVNTPPYIIRKIDNQSRSQELLDAWDLLTRAHIQTITGLSPSIHSFLPLSSAFLGTSFVTTLGVNRSPVEFLKAARILKSKYSNDADQKNQQDIINIEHDHGAALLERIVPVYHGLLKLEPSTKWPLEDSQAMHALQTAYLLRLSKALNYNSTHNKSIEDMVKASGDNESSATASKIWSSVSFASPPYLDVLFKGFVFRLYLDLEDAVSSDSDSIALTSILSMPNGKKSSSLAPYTSSVLPNYATLSSSSIVDKNWFLFQPIQKHLLFVKQYCHRYPTTYAGTTRLLYQWFSMHQISPSMVSQEAVELIAAKVFPLSPFRTTSAMLPNDTCIHNAPNTPWSGFLRAMQWISTFDFSMSPFIIFDQQPDENTVFKIVERDGVERAYGSLEGWIQYTTEQFTKHRKEQSHPDWTKDAAVVPQYNAYMTKAIYFVTGHDIYSDFCTVNMSLKSLAWIQQSAKLLLNHADLFSPNTSHIFQSPSNFILPKNLYQTSIKIHRGDMLQKFRLQLLGNDTAQPNLPINWVSTLMTPGFDPVKWTIYELEKEHEDMDIFIQDMGQTAILSWKTFPRY